MAVGPINQNPGPLPRIDAREGNSRNTETARSDAGQGDSPGIGASVALDVPAGLDISAVTEAAGPGPASLDEARDLARIAQQSLSGQEFGIANRNPDRLAGLVR
jgi:hypothetical protein